MTLQEILEVVKEPKIAEWFMCCDPDEVEDDIKLPTNVSSINRYNYGGEGMGEEYWSVYEFFEDGKSLGFIKFDGYYYSYDGSTFDAAFIAEPYQEMVTKYRSKG